MTDQKTPQAECASLLSIRLGWLKRNTCRHEFALEDLHRTLIQELEKPTTNGYSEWERYFQNIYTHESQTKRVMWPCCKCGKVFYAHCGLDIYAHGRPKQIGPNV